MVILCRKIIIVLFLVLSVNIVPVNAITIDNYYSTELYNYLFTVAWVTDTQQYFGPYIKHPKPVYPERFQQMINYINSREDVTYVVNAGDLIQYMANVTQWDMFVSMWDDLKVTADVLAGNHDNCQWTLNWSMYDKYFPNRRYYYRIKHGYIFIFLSWQVLRNETVQNWFENVIKTHDEKAIILTHYYLGIENRTKRKEAKIYGCDCDTFTNLDGNTDAQLIFNVLSKYDKDYIVLCGHQMLIGQRCYNPETEKIIKGTRMIVYAKEKNVIGVLHNFQAYAYRGNGYFVIIDFYGNGLYMYAYSDIEKYKGTELSIVYYEIWGARLRVRGR